ncbi:MAG TPA: M28 family peptidase [Actinomycetota bacterium]|nr:M28 family peptidase [Actinomycetota bacterium]
MIDIARELSVGIGERVKGTDGERRAADIIEMHFDAAGCQTSRQTFTRAAGGTSQNVICRVPEADFSHGWTVIGGHYDTVPGSPGGNDNASGSALTVALAEAFVRSRAPIEFVAFSSEERDRATRAHHEGSRAYVAQLSAPGMVLAMISPDMIANGPRLHITIDRSHPGQLGAELLTLADELKIPAFIDRAGDVSDHTSFTRVGVPAVALWTGRRPEYHSAGDTFDTVDRASLMMSITLMDSWLRRRYGL